MAQVNLEAYTSATTFLGAELNALADATDSAASSAYDNSSLLDLWMDLELVLAATSARSAGATVSVYMTTRFDGTNYGDASYATAELVAVFPLDAATTARRAVRQRIPIPPENFKLFARGAMGVAFAASGSTIKGRMYSTNAS